jgi:hypothetical protein
MEWQQASVSSKGSRDEFKVDRDARAIDPNLPAPNFLIVGAAKAGTTSLHAYLRQHPEVFMSAFKEPHYFSSFESAPEFDSYMPVIRDSYTYQTLFAGSEGYKAVGEASPSYLCDSNAARRIRSALPTAKIIISLRDPVERAFSHYLMEYRQGRETRSFPEALRADEMRSEKGWGKSFMYVELGLYAEQIQRYLEVFGRGRVLVVLFEDLIHETAAVMKEIAQFLEVDPERFPSTAFDRVHNPYERSRGRVARLVLRSRPIRIWSKRWIPQRLRTIVRNRFLFTTGQKPRLDEESRRVLAERFAPDVARLEDLLQRNLHKLQQNW